MSSDSQAVELEHLMLDILTTAKQETISRQLLKHANVRVIAGILGEELTVQLYTYLLADKRLTERQSIPFATKVQVPQRFRDRIGLLFGKKTMRASGNVTVRAERRTTPRRARRGTRSCPYSHQGLRCRR